MNCGECKYRDDNGRENTQFTFCPLRHMERKRTSSACEPMEENAQLKKEIIAITKCENHRWVENVELCQSKKDLKEHIAEMYRELTKERAIRYCAEDEKEQGVDTMLRQHDKIRKLEKELDELRKHIAGLRCLHPREVPISLYEMGEKDCGKCPPCVERDRLDNCRKTLEKGDK